MIGGPLKTFLDLRPRLFQATAPCPLSWAHLALTWATEFTSESNPPAAPKKTCWYTGVFWSGILDLSPFCFERDLPLKPVKVQALALASQHSKVQFIAMSWGLMTWSFAPFHLMEFGCQAWKLEISGNTLPRARVIFEYFFKIMLPNIWCHIDIIDCHKIHSTCF